MSLVNELLEKNCIIVTSTHVLAQLEKNGEFLDKSKELIKWMKEEFYNFDEKNQHFLVIYSQDNTKYQELFDCKLCNDKIAIDNTEYWTTSLTKAYLINQRIGHENIKIF